MQSTRRPACLESQRHHGYSIGKAREKEFFKAKHPISRVQPEPYRPACPAHLVLSGLEPRVASPQEEEPSPSVALLAHLAAGGTEVTGEAEPPGCSGDR